MEKPLMLCKTQPIIYPEEKRVLFFGVGKKAGSSRSWSRTAKYLYNNMCLITGYCTGELYLRSSVPKSAKLHTHHLYGRDIYPQLADSYLNALPILDEFHKDFHRIYGQNVTAKDFVNYLEFLKKSPCDEKGFYTMTNLDKLINWVNFLDKHIKLTSAFAKTINEHTSY